MGGPWGARERTVKDERKAEARAARLRAVVYFVEDADGNIKIGRATDIYVRFAMLQNAHARAVTLLATEPGGQELERTLHLRFASARIRGEWFHGTPEIRSYIEGLPR